MSRRALARVPYRCDRRGARRGCLADVPPRPVKWSSVPRAGSGSASLLSGLTWLRLRNFRRVLGLRPAA